MPKLRSAVPCSDFSRWSEKEARDALALHAVSGLSVQAFAAREGLDRQRIYYWRRGLAGQPTRATPRPATVPAFVEIRHREPTMVEIALRSGRVLRVAESIAPSSLRRLLDVLDEAGPC